MKSLDKTVFINTFIIVAINGIALLFYHKKNPNKDAERYYHANEKHKYYLLKFAYSILFISFVFNTRYLVSTCLKIGLKHSLKMFLPKI